ESQVGDVLNQKSWESLPLETRSQNEFILNLAGVVPDSGTGRGASVDGARTGTGNFLVEGYDNNDQGLGGGGSLYGPGGANTTISPDAIAEYRVIEHLPPAEYGKAGGFVTDTVLRSGTDQYHGSLFEYNRVQALAANSFFSNSSGETDHLVRNQFGGSVGGPIIKGKTFFFFTTEAHRVRSSSPLTFTSTTQQFVDFVNSGQFEQFMESGGPSADSATGGLCVNIGGGPCPGGLPNSATLGTVFKQLQTAEPFPLAATGDKCGQGFWTGAGNGYTNLLNPGAANPCGDAIQYPVPVYGEVTVSQPTQTNQIRYSTKIDQKISDRHQLSGTFLYDNADSITKYAGGDGYYGPDLPQHGRAMNAGITWTWTLSPTMTNQARMAYVRHTGDFPGDSAANTAKIPALATAFDATGFSFGNASNLPQFFTENAFIYRDDLSIIKGKHSFKFGVSYERTRNGSSFNADIYGEILPYDIEDFMTDETFGDNIDSLFFGGPAYGSWYEASAAVVPATGAVPDFYRGYRANEYGGYAQDDWRITRTLTLNLGVRYDYFGPPHNYQPGLDSNFYFGSDATPFPTASNNPFMPVNSPVYARIANGAVQQKNSDIWAKDYNNFAPRVGFSWDSWGNQKLVVRGGYGIGYDRMYNNIFENIRFNPPGYCQCAFGALINGTPGGNLETPGIYGVPFTGTAQFVNPDLFPNGLPAATLRHMDQNMYTPYYEQINFGIQTEFAKDYVFEADYIGTFGKGLLGLVNMNTFDGRTVGAPYSSKRINPNYTNDSMRTNAFNSNYNGLQLVVRKRFTNGLQFNANYTYSKALDQLSDVFTLKTGAAYPTDNMNIWNDYGPADFDLRHRFVGSFSYDMPFWKENKLLGGWGISGIVTLQSGTGFSVIDTNHDANKDGIYGDRVSYTGGGPITNAILGKGSPADGYFNPNAFADTTCPATVNQGLWCNGGTGRNALYGPGLVNADFGVSKKFRIGERMSFTFMANFFNLFNHPNFGNPDGNLASPTFGASTSTASPRITQLALRFDF
ncbi:MAG TPA: TonB-dependent receptor, partial [Dongiaceae bacterium]|nr:TonB-dependent receptor [Dongiaceae bacterium]